MHVRHHVDIWYSTDKIHIQTKNLALICSITCQVRIKETVNSIN